MKKLKTFFKTVLVLALSLTIASGFTSTAYAAEEMYHSEDYEIVSGYWMMDNRHGHNQHVNLYIMIENNANYTMYEQGYDFKCYSNLVEGDEGVFTFDGKSNANFSYDFLAANGKEVTTFGNDTVYVFTFGVLPGEYTFAPCGGNEGIQMGDALLTLTETMQCPVEQDEEYKNYGYFADGYYPEGHGMNFGTNEIVTIEAGKDHNLYAWYGSNDWTITSESVTEFIDWAKEHKAEYANANNGSGETETIVETPVVEEEPTLSFGGNTEEEEETITTPDTETTTEVTTPEVVEKESNFGWLWIVGIIVVAVVAIVVMKKKK